MTPPNASDLSTITTHLCEDYFKASTTSAPPSHADALISSSHRVMGISCVAMKVARCITTPSTLRDLLSHFKFLLAIALSYLGLKDNPRHQEDHNVSEQLLPTNYFLVNSLSPSLVPVPLHILAESIKTRLPVLEYGEFLERYNNDESPSTSCAICLSSLEKRDEIRELCNCVHVFHGQCLDTWVDENKVTCPLCRSLMFPATDDLKRCGEVPGRIHSNG